MEDFENNMQLKVALDYQAYEQEEFSLELANTKYLGSISNAIITGEWGTGKSTLLRQILIEKNRKEIILNFFSLQGNLPKIGKVIEEIGNISLLNINEINPIICFEDLEGNQNTEIFKDIIEFIYLYPQLTYYIVCTPEFLKNNKDFQVLNDFYYIKIELLKGGKDEVLRQIIINNQRQYFAVGSAWGRYNDQAERFFKYGIWEIGDEKLKHIVNSIKLNDILILKSTFHSKGNGFFRVKAIGIVNQLPLDNLTVGVNWFIRYDKVDILGKLSRLRHRISPLQINDVLEIFSYLNLEELLKSGIFTNSDQEDIYSQFDGSDTEENPNSFIIGTSRIQNSPPVLTDSNTKDSLNFEKDVQSLAAVLALKEMKPPLAIALLGDWGSGKSFFMTSLSKRIKQLSLFGHFLKDGEVNHETTNNQDSQFINGIAHINFNAWSYMDANLWAGLAHSMYEKLNLYIANNTKSELERLKVQATIAKRLDILHNSINDFSTKKDYLIKFRQNLELEKTYRILRYFSSENDNTVVEFLKETGLTKDEIELLTPGNINNALKSGIRFINYLKSYRHQILTGTVTAIVIYMVLYSTLSNYKDLISYFIWGPIIPFSIYSVKFIIKKSTSLRKYTKILSQLENPKTKDQINNELDNLGNELNQLDKLIHDVNLNIQIENEKFENITEAAISEFIISKSNHQEYEKHLGIITTIRKDFETLSELFYDLDNSQRSINPYEEKHIEELTKDKKEISSAFQDCPKLERIILYIDDLDRCSEDKILQVLQAVHLLMAFPLFIVVVGVDERSVNNALNYEFLNRYKGIDTSLVKEKIFVVEPHEYLEKIFQIPFQVPIPSRESVTQLVIDSINPIINDKDENESDTALNHNDSIHPNKNEMLILDNNTFTNLTQNNPEEDFEEELIEEVDSQKTVEILSLNNIILTEFEKEYLGKLALIVGFNPRKIKRFINVYRILKTHENHLFDNEENTLIIMLLIALSLNKDRSKVFDLFNEYQINIHDMENNEHFAELLNRYKIDNEAINNLYFTDSKLYEVLINPINKFLPFWGFVQRFSFKLTKPKNDLMES